MHYIYEQESMENLGVAVFLHTLDRVMEPILLVEVHFTFYLFLNTLKMYVTRRNINTTKQVNVAIGEVTIK